MAVDVHRISSTPSLLIALPYSHQDCGQCLGIKVVDAGRARNEIIQEKVGSGPMTAASNVVVVQGMPLML